MHLMYCEVCTKYTLKKVCECNKPTRSAHPGQWSERDTKGADDAPVPAGECGRDGRQCEGRWGCGGRIAFQFYGALYAIALSMARR